MAKIKRNKINHHTLDEALETFLINVKEKGLSETTYATYKQNVLIFIEAFPDLSVEQINDDTLKEFKHWLSEHRNFNSVSTNTTYRTINIFFTFLYEEYHIQHYKLDYIKEVRKIKKGFTDDEIRLLTRKPDLLTCHYSEYRDYIITLLALNTGVRVGSLANVKVNDVDFKAKTIYFSHMKNSKPQIFPLNRQLLKELKEYINVCDLHEYLFENSLHKKATSKQLSVSFRRYCLNRGCRTTSIHQLRAKFASKLIQETGDVFLVMRALNHSTPTVTMRYLQSIGINDYSDKLQDFNLLDKLKG